MRSKRRRPTRADLDAGESPIRLSDLAAMVGWSRQKLLTDSQHGNLALAWVRCGTRRIATVDRSEAARYYDSFYRGRRDDVPRPTMNGSD